MPWFGDMNPRILFCAKSNNALDIIGRPWFGDMNPRTQLAFNDFS
jgi:hypothetical protein